MHEKLQTKMASTQGQTKMASTKRSTDPCTEKPIGKYTSVP
jgi:hypothetical protein